MAYPSGALILLEAETLDATLSDGDPVAAWAATQGLSPTPSGTLNYEAANADLGSAVAIASGVNSIDCAGLSDASAGITLAIAVSGLDIATTSNVPFLDAQTGRTYLGVRASGRPYLFDSTYRTFDIADALTNSAALLTFVIDGTGQVLTVYEGRTVVGTVVIGGYNGLGGAVKLLSNYLGQGASGMSVGMIGIWPGIAEATRTAIWDEAYAHYPALVSAPAGADTTAPVVAEVSAPSAGSPTDPWVVDVTDETSLAHVSISVIDAANNAALIWDGQQFRGEYDAGSAEADITDGKRFTIAPAVSWYGALTLLVVAVDGGGNVTRQTYAATGATPPTDSPPSVTVIQAPARRTDAMVVEVTDDAGLALSMWLARFPDGDDYDVVFDGTEFAPKYEGSSRVAITGGYRYTLFRKGGWGPEVILSDRTVDTGGQLSA